MKSASGLLLGALCVSSAFAQVIIAEPPVRSTRERARVVPPAVVPKNLNGMPRATLHPELARTSLEGVVIADGKPVAGALVVSVDARPWDLDAVQGPCISCTSSNAAVCGCGAAVDVLVARLDARSDESRVVDRTTTDASGHFVVRGSSSPAVWVDAPGRVPLFFRPTMGVFEARIDLTERTPFPLISGVVLDESRAPVAEAIVTWPSPDGRLFDAVTGTDGTFQLAVRGQVRGLLARRAGYQAKWYYFETSRPALVLLDPRTLRVEFREGASPAAGVPVRLSSERCTASTQTDDAGVATFSGLVAGPYSLVAGEERFGARKETGLGFDSERRLAPISLRPLASLEVEVEGLPDAGYPPYLSVNVHCPWDEDRSLKSSGPAAWAAGWLPPGECLVEVSHDEFRSAQWVTLEGNKGSKLKVPLSELKRVPPARPVPDVVPAVNAASRIEKTPPSPPEHLSGELVSAQGQPITDFDLNGRRVTDPRGHFEARADEHEVRLFAPGLGSRTRGMEATGGPVVLDTPHVVTVQLLDPAGAPLPQATLMRAGGDSICARWIQPEPVDAEGRGWLTLNGTQRPRASAPGFRSVDFEAAADGGVREVRLEPGTATLEGRVLRAGKPVRGAEVCVSGPDAQRAVTRPDGTFTITGLTSGTWTVEATDVAQRAWSTKRSVTLKDGKQSVKLEAR